jgi:hypothetical protein
MDPNEYELLSFLASSVGSLFFSRTSVGSNDSVSLARRTKEVQVQNMQYGPWASSQAMALHDAGPNCFSNGQFMDLSAEVAAIARYHFLALLKISSFLERN